MVFQDYLNLGAPCMLQLHVWIAKVINLNTQGVSALKFIYAISCISV
jgi:hypothetical protein